MAILIQVDKSGRERQEVGAEHPLFVQIKQSPESPADIPVTSKLFTVSRRAIPGIGTGAAYATGDAFGTKFFFDVPPQGTISTMLFYDYDDEGLAKELVLFRADFTATADNAAFAVSDDDGKQIVGVVAEFSAFDLGSMRILQAIPSLYYDVPEGRLYAQWLTRGADNIAAGAIPDFMMVIS